MNSIRHYASPTSLEDAVCILAEGETTRLAGGTDLMPQTRSGAVAFAPLLMSLRRIPDLAGISRQEGRIRLGALTTVTTILGSELLRDAAPVLPTAADRFAAGQIRNSATVGGNLCNASPAGDLAIPLLLLDAQVHLASWQDKAMVVRIIPLAEFFVGPGRTVARPEELLTSICFPRPGKGFAVRFEKFGTRPALDISVVSVGVAGRLEGGALKDVRIALGAVAPTPLRGRQTEQLLEGRILTDEMIAQAVSTAREEIAPISDVRASAWYRKELVGVYVRRLLTDVSQS